MIIEAAGGQQRQPNHVQVMSPTETLIMALCGMGGVAIISAFLCIFFHFLYILLFDFM